MRHLRRILFTCIVVTLAVAWLGVVGLWVRSYWRGDAVLRIGDTTTLLLLSGDGGACVAVGRHARTSDAWSVTPPWQVSTNPQYPQPGARMRSLTLTGTVTLALPPNSAANAPAGNSMTLRAGQLTLNAPPAGVVGSIKLTGAGSLAFGTGNGVVITSKVAGFVVGNGTGGGTNSTAAAATYDLSSDLRLGMLPQRPNAAPGPVRFAAYRVSGAAGSVGTRTWVVIFPYWFAATMLGPPIVLLVWFDTRRRGTRRRLFAGLCLTCGYDLRATPERCPECGAVSRVPNSQDHG